MTNYLLVYTGGSEPTTPEEGQAVMNAWMGWFGKLGESLVDGGRPVGTSKSIAPGGAVNDATSSGVTGYSVIAAASLDEAVEKARGCPHLQAGGTVEVFETIDPTQGM